MPSQERRDVLFVASPAWDDRMISAARPGITRASKQTRGESLKMFYANNEFRAYVEYLDFRNLIDWARCTTSSPKLRVHVHMLHKMSCLSGLVPFAEAWRDLDYARFHLELHSCWHSNFGFGKRQCEQVVKSIEIAETADSDTSCFGGCAKSLAGTEAANAKTKRATGNVFLSRAARGSGWSIEKCVGRLGGVEDGKAVREGLVPRDSVRAMEKLSMLHRAPLTLYIDFAIGYERKHVKTHRPWPTRSLTVFRIYHKSTELPLAVSFPPKLHDLT